MMKDLIKTKYWEVFTGGDDQFSLETKIFHGVCLLLLLVLLVAIPLNYFTHLPQVAILLFVVLVILCGVYFLSRVKNKVMPGIIIFQVVGNLFLATHYIYNSGIDGPSCMIFVLMFFISVAITPVKQYKFWLPINVLLFLGLLMFDYYHPGIYPSATRARLIDFGSSYVIIVAVVYFITTIIRNAYYRQGQQLQQKASALAASNETKNKLLSIMAHDLKEPLSSIQSYLELLSDYELNEADRIKIGKELLNRTKDTSYMLANVLSWTKQQMEAVQIHLSSLKLAETLEPTLHLLKSFAKEKGITFNSKIANSLCVIGDKDMLQLVVRNIINNAIKFTFRDGKIDLMAETKGANCVITITDTGAGIPYSKQKELFSLRVESTFGTGHEKGVGLGLLLCKEFIELQGGEIGFTSKPNIGSSFFVSLPCCPLTAQSSNPIIASVV